MFQDGPKPEVDWKNLTRPSFLARRYALSWWLTWDPAATRVISGQLGCPLAAEESCGVPRGAESSAQACGRGWPLKGVRCGVGGAGVSKCEALLGRNGNWAPCGPDHIGAEFGFTADVPKRNCRLSAFLPVWSPLRYGSRWVSQALKKSQ